MELAGRAADAGSLMSALSNANRLMILRKFRRGEHSVGAPKQAIGLNQSALSQHLARLRAAGLVKTRREGVSIVYWLADLKVSRVIATFYVLFCPQKHRVST